MEVVAAGRSVAELPWNSKKFATPNVNDYSPSSRYCPMTPIVKEGWVLWVR